CLLVLSPLTSPFRLAFFLMPRPPRSTLSPYTTLFRSAVDQLAQRVLADRHLLGAEAVRLHLPLHEVALGDLELLLLRVPGQLDRSEEHTSELQSRENLVCRLLLEKKKAPLSLPAVSYQ